VSYYTKQVSAVVFASILGAASAGAASAHSFSAAPVHVSSRSSGGHGYGAHGGHGFWGGFLHALFGIDDGPVVVVQPVGYAPAGAMPFGYEADFAATRVAAEAPILSDEARYRAATGLALPPRHGLVLVPPTTPRGDDTWIWSNAGAN